MTDVVVIGAGISGSAAAYELAKNGWNVTLVDRYGPAAMASGWTLAGVRQSGRHPAELPLAKAAVEIWLTLAEELGAPTHYKRGGNLRCARNEKEVSVIERLVKSQSDAGLDVQFLHGKEVRSLAPIVSEKVLAASLCMSDGQADPISTVSAFVNAAQRAGATLRFGEKVLSITVEGERVTSVVTDKGQIPTRHVVVAAGVFGNDLINPLGLHVPFDVMSATIIRSAAMPRTLEQVIGVANGDTTGRQEYDNHFRIGGGHEYWDGAMDDGERPVVYPKAASIAEVLERFCDLVPSFKAAGIERAWAGLIDQTVDAIPVIDTAPEIEGLVLALGFSGHGFCLGPITGKIIAALVEGKRPDLPIEAFTIDRFKDMQASSSTVTLHG
ncbi:NAD(P)/FAD-dependent oxidoreductase [Microvirga pudoricolor]|uniref:NAD(P)/FAD-dependent oxidoreductase n=1 Tax=Microvirga pudoricolor TaxID=2778729 RepID=UPI001952470B|nr:FAD-binding oxidoreductase [Microvirga pudoricolor]MBM6595135.1 FAD-binding oxidoreductase [Microvirga pudoricolor]